MKREIRSGRRPREHAVHARLINWGHWAGGGVPGLSMASYDPTDTRPTIDEADAQRVEQVLLTIKGRRSQYYRMIRLQYLRRLDDPSLCTALRLRDRQLQDLRARVLQFMAGALAVFDRGD